jgi:hypothetical protein
MVGLELTINATFNDGEIDDFDDNSSDTRH